MKRDIALEAAIVEKYVAIAPVLDERARRLWAATEARAIGYGGDALVSAATGLARETIRNGRREIEHGVDVTGRVRRAGAGRPDIEQAQPGIKEALEQLVDPLSRGDPNIAIALDVQEQGEACGGVVEERLDGQCYDSRSLAPRTWLQPAVGAQEPRGRIAPRSQCAV